MSEPIPPLKILLVEDDELFRLGLRFRLQQESDIEIAAEVADGETAVAIASCHPLDVVLLDIGLPRMSGLEACHAIHATRPHLPILVLTSHAESAVINRAIESGAAGYCLKGVASETLILAIRSVAAGASWWDTHATNEIRSAVVERELMPPRPQINLTIREQEILKLMAAGKTDRDISTMLYIAPATVRVHIHSILTKLGTRDRHTAVRFAQLDRGFPPA